MASAASVSLVALLPAVLSAGAAVVSVVYGRRAVRRDRLDEADTLAYRFREPLLQSAHNLQSRLFNIVRLEFFERFHAGLDATPRDQAYAVHNTAFLFAQYFGWVEIVRRESLHLDPRNKAQNRAISRRLEAVRDTLADSDSFSSRVLRLFRGEQRGIGEVMLAPAQEPQTGAPRWDCMGYAAFTTASRSAPMQPWIGLLESDVEVLAAESSKHDDRIVALQHSLVDLMDTLDPQCERVAPELRQRL